MKKRPGCAFVIHVAIVIGYFLEFQISSYDIFSSSNLMYFQGSTIILVIWHAETWRLSIVITIWFSSNMLFYLEQYLSTAAIFKCNESVVFISPAPKNSFLVVRHPKPYKIHFLRYIDMSILSCHISWTHKKIFFVVVVGEN